MDITCPEFNLTQSKKEIEKLLKSLFDEIEKSKEVDGIVIHFENEQTKDYFDDDTLRISFWFNQAFIDVESNGLMFNPHIGSITEKKAASMIYNLLHMGFNYHSTLEVV